MTVNATSDDVQGRRIRTGRNEMLALTRKPGQSIVIGGLNGEYPQVTITILDIDHGRVAVGFIAPNGVPIHRMEIWTGVLAREEVSIPVFGEQKGGRQ